MVGISTGFLVGLIVGVWGVPAIVRAVQDHFDGR